MPIGNFKETHQKIIDSGLELFQQNGYERTTLRDVCKNAGITTGAFYRHFEDKHSLFAELVNPVVTGINHIFEECGNTFYTTFENDHSSDIRNMNIFIDFLYDHFDIFKLLLECSDGTAFTDFIDLLAIKEDETTKRMYHDLKNKGASLEELNENEIHMLNHAYFSSIFEAVLHNYSKEKALEYAKTIQKFFSAGWRDIVFR